MLEDHVLKKDLSELAGESQALAYRAQTMDKLKTTLQKLKNSTNNQHQWHAYSAIQYALRFQDPNPRPDDQGPRPDRRRPGACPGRPGPHDARVASHNFPENRRQGLPRGAGEVTRRPPGYASVDPSRILQTRPPMRDFTHCPLCYV